MSRKITAFRALNVAPKTTCNYCIWIPNVLTSVVNVETASVPSAEILTSSFYVRGLQYSLPVKKKAQGTWSCTMYENMFLNTIYQVLHKQHKEAESYEGVLNTILNVSLHDIYIFLTDEVSGNLPVACCILKDCFLTKVGEIKLNANGATEQMKLQLDFWYNGVKDCYVMAKDILGGASVSPALASAAVGAISIAASQANKSITKTEDILKNIKSAF